jgi:hypothetical protein
VPAASGWTNHSLSHISVLIFLSNKVSDQRSVIEDPLCRAAIEQMKSDSASLLVLRDTDSIFSYVTDNLSKISKEFRFDRLLFGTKVYGKALRGSIKKSLQLQQAISRPGARHTFPNIDLSTSAVETTTFTLVKTKSLGVEHERLSMRIPKSTTASRVDLNYYSLATMMELKDPNSPNAGKWKHIVRFATLECVRAYQGAITNSLPGHPVSNVEYPWPQTSGEVAQMQAHEWATVRSIAAQIRHAESEAGVVQCGKWSEILPRWTN